MAAGLSEEGGLEETAAALTEHEYLLLARQQATIEQSDAICPVGPQPSSFARLRVREPQTGDVSGLLLPLSGSSEARGGGGCFSKFIQEHNVEVPAHIFQIDVTYHSAG